MDAQTVGQPKAIPALVEQLRKESDALVCHLETLEQRLVPVMREVQKSENPPSDENRPSCALQGDLSVCQAQVEQAQGLVLSMIDRLEL